MKATLNGSVIADSADTVSIRGYDYFPISSARMEMAREDAEDREGPSSAHTACSSTTSWWTDSAIRATPGSTSGRSPP